MSFNIPFGVYVAGADPIDAERYIAADIATRDALVTNGRAGNGQQVWVLSEKKLYILEDVTGPTWAEVGGGGATPFYGDEQTSTVRNPSIDMAKLRAWKWIDVQLIINFSNLTEPLTVGQSIQVDYRYLFFGQQFKYQQVLTSTTGNVKTGSGDVKTFELILNARVDTLHILELEGSGGVLDLNPQLDVLDSDDLSSLPASPNYNWKLLFYDAV